MANSRTGFHNEKVAPQLSRTPSKINVVVQPVKNRLPPTDPMLAVRKIQGVKWVKGKEECEQAAKECTRRTSLVNTEEVTPGDHQAGIVPMKEGPIIKRIRVKVQKGLLHAVQAEVLVNTTGKNLDFSKDAISSSLLSIAGEGIQKELKKRYEGKVKFGEVLKTGVGMLQNPCKAIFHGVLPAHRYSDSVTVFNNFIHNCLEEANKYNYTSIALPPVGTGNLCYPKDLVASMMFQSVAKFEKAHSTSRLEKVIFVIHETDQETLKIFEDMLKKCVDKIDSDESTDLSHSVHFGSDSYDPKNSLGVVSIDGKILHDDPMSASRKSDTAVATTTDIAVAPTTGGTLAPTTGGTVVPATGGTLASTTGGTVVPTAGGTVVPATCGTLAPTTAGTLAPTTGGTVVTATRGTLSPTTDKSCVLKLLINYVKLERDEVEDDTFLHRVQCSLDFHALWNFCNQTDCGRKMLESILIKHHCHVSLANDKPLQGSFLFEIFEKKFKNQSDVKQFVKVILDTVWQNGEKEFFLETFTVDPRLHKDVLESVRQTKELDSVCIESGGEQNHEICLVCLLEHKMIATQRLSDLISATEECFKNHEEFVHVDLMWQNVMIKFGYLEEVKNKFPKLRINWDESKNVFVLKGPRDEARTAAGALSEILGTARHEISEVSFQPTCQFEIFTHPEMCAYINKFIPEQAVLWLLNHVTKKIHLFAKDPKQLHGIDKAIKGCVLEKLYPVSKDHSIPTHKTSICLEELKKQHTGRLVIHPSTGGLLVTTADDVYEIVDAAIQELINREAGADQDGHEIKKQDKNEEQPLIKPESKVKQRDWFYPNGKKITLVNATSCNANVIILPGKSDVDGQPQFGNKIILRLKVPEWNEGKAKYLSEEFEQILKQITDKTVGIYIKAVEGWKFDIYLKCFLFKVKKYLMKSEAEPCPIECVTLLVEHLLDYTESIKIIEESFRLVQDKSEAFTSHRLLLKSQAPLFKRIKVKVQKGELHTAQAEVLVNTVDSNLDLKKGLISSALLDKAGEGIQKELNQYKGKVVFGEVLKTGVGLLPKPCQAIFHGVLNPYKGLSESIKVFIDFILGCLVEANKMYQTIAFPPIGTGSLHYPNDLVASIMLKSVAKFEELHFTSRLEEVIFVISEKDPETMKIFEDMHRICIVKGGDQTTIIDHDLGDHSKYQHDTIPEQGAMSPKGNWQTKEKQNLLTPIWPQFEETHVQEQKIYCYKPYQNMTVKIYTADITTLKGVETIVCTDDRRGNGHGAIASALWKTGKSKYQSDKKKAFGKNVHFGDVIITEGGDSNFHSVIHAVVPSQEDQILPQRHKEFVHKCYERILNCTNNWEKASLALPIIDADYAELDYLGSAELFIDSLEVFCTRAMILNIKVIHIVDKDEQTTWKVAEVFRKFTDRVRRHSLETWDLFETWDVLY